MSFLTLMDACYCIRATQINAERQEKLRTVRIPTLGRQFINYVDFVNHFTVHGLRRLNYVTVLCDATGRGVDIL